MIKPEGDSVAMLSSPLLIGGCPRSGTTALLQVLNTNSSCYISSEENVLKILECLKKTLSTQERRNEVISKNGMRAVSPRESLNRINIHSHNFSQESVWATLQFIYEFHHQKLHRDFPLILWGDKFPYYFKEIEILLNVPGLKYLHITRNPLDVVNSMVRRSEMTRQGKDWWKAITGFSEMLEVWVEAFQEIQRFENESKVLHIHYEELVFDFFGSIGKINKFLGLNLNYENVLISEQDKHFNREFLTEDMIGRILSHPVVKDYVHAVKSLSCVSVALPKIPSI